MSSNFSAAPMVLGFRVPRLRRSVDVRVRTQRSRTGLTSAAPMRWVELRAMRGALVRCVGYLRDVELRRDIPRCGFAGILAKWLRRLRVVVSFGYR